MYEDEPVRSVGVLIKAATELSGTRGSQGAVHQRIVKYAQEAVPPSDIVSLTLAGTKGLVTAAASGRRGEEVDAIQYRTGQGPCLAAVKTGQLVLVRDLADDARWPLFVAEAKQLSVRSILALPLEEGREVRGSINLASGRRNAFSPWDRETARALSAIAALALAAASERERSTKAADLALRLARVVDYELRSRLTVLLAAAEVVRRRVDASDAAGKQAADLLMSELGHEQRTLAAALRASQLDEAEAGTTSRRTGGGRAGEG